MLRIEPGGVLGVAEDVDAAVVAVGLVQDGHLVQHEPELVQFWRQKVEKFSRQKSGIVLVHAGRRVLSKKFRELKK